jgi:hypothetical protein
MCTCVNQETKFEVEIMILKGKEVSHGREKIEKHFI